MNVIAFDPGKATGVACYQNFVHTSFQLNDGFKGVADFLDPVDDDGYYDPVGPLYPYDAVVCETFTVNATTHKKDSGAFIEVFSNIGAIRYAAYLADVPFYLQTPAEAKSFGTNDKLRKLGWFAGGAGHADDASRHLLTFLAKQRDPDILERLTCD